MYLFNWWRLTKRRVHEPEVEVAFSGERVAAEGHRYLLHRDLKTSRLERLDKDVGRPADSSKRGRAVGRHRADERQRRLVRSQPNFSYIGRPRSVATPRITGHALRSAGTASRPAFMSFLPRPWPRAFGDTSIMPRPFARA